MLPLPDLKNLDPLRNSDRVQLFTERNRRASKTDGDFLKLLKFRVHILLELNACCPDRELLTRDNATRRVEDGNIED